MTTVNVFLTLDYLDGIATAHSTPSEWKTSVHINLYMPY